MRLKTIIRVWWIVMMLTLIGVVQSTLAQEQDGSGRGVIREGNVSGASSTTPLNPILCAINASCNRLTDLMFPSLLGIDPVSGTFASADADGVIGSLALDWEYDGNLITLTLREDALWSDGTPITAYDVLFTIEAILELESASPYFEQLTGGIDGEPDVIAVALLDDHTIMFLFDGALCGSLWRLQLPIIPAHAFDPDYAQAAADAFANDGVNNGATVSLEQYQAWTAREDQNFKAVLENSFNDAPTITAGAFQFDERRATEYIRLTSPDGELGFEYVDVPDRQTEVDRVLRGELNLILNPPFDRRDDLRAAETAGNLRSFEVPGRTWVAINFNLADPSNPLSAYDDDGNLQEQGVHPIFGDVRVRRAVQLGLDVQAIIDSALYGEGTVIAANQPPTSWGINPDLAPVPFDPAAAVRLLEEAGWIDEDFDGVRECIRCTTAPEGTELRFDLFYPDTLIRYSVTADLIRQQLGRLGISVSTSLLGDNEGSMRFQNYDAYLAVVAEDYPVNPDQWARFTRAGDVIGSGANTSSYHNPEIEALLSTRYDTLTCNANEQVAAYRRVQTLLQADQPYAWLYVANQFTAVSSGVQNFDPVSYFPLRNIENWVVVE